MSIMRSAFPFSVAVSLGLFAAGVWAAGPEPGINVTVTNPPTQPVPVSIQGTGSITGNVTVTNTPNVAVINEVKVLDPAKLAFSIREDYNFSAGNDVKFQFLGLPTGKVYAIEHVSVRCSSSATDAFADVYMQILTPGTDSGTSFNLNPLQRAGKNIFDNAGVQYTYILSQSLKIYTDASASVALAVSHTDLTSAASCQAYVGGYAVTK